MDSKKSSDIAKRNFKAEDYHKKDQISKGLAETHEQATDTWKDGYNADEKK